MTRVELPRRGSFLKTGSTRRPNTITGGTPLGFTELFDEFRNQEGLTSVDDILATIIGKGFNIKSRGPWKCKLIAISNYSNSLNANESNSRMQIYIF